MDSLRPKKLCQGVGKTCFGWSDAKKAGSTNQMVKIIIIINILNLNVDYFINGIQNNNFINIYIHKQNKHFSSHQKGLDFFSKSHQLLIEPVIYLLLKILNQNYPPCLPEIQRYCYL